MRAYPSEQKVYELFSSSNVYRFKYESSKRDFVSFKCAHLRLNAQVTRHYSHSLFTGKRC